VRQSSKYENPSVFVKMECDQGTWGKQPSERNSDILLCTPAR